MHVHVHIAGTHLVALLDTGSTQNFIDTDAATRAGLTLLGPSDLQVAVANDDCVTSPGCCHDLSVSIDNE
jgi:predicted aspartyl protease